MSVLSALERELVAVECELLDLLRLALPVCAKNGTLLFFNSQNLPDEYQHHWLPVESDQLFELATRCSSVRSKLGQSSAQTIAQLFLDAYAESANLKNPHRRGPRRLATWLLAEIQSRQKDT
jgi:hypothetical protein